MNLKQEVICFAKKIGFDRMGFTTAEPFFKEKKILAEKMAKNLLSPFEEQDIKLRCDPNKILAGAKTIICFAMGYLVNHHYPVKTDPDEINGDSAGKISRYARIKDYHFVLAKKLEKMVDFISKKEAGQFKIIVDTGSLLEKAAAQRAGLGWIGENTCLFTPELGSWVFLGEIITDIEFEPDTPMVSKCDSCGRCVKACPTGALMAPFQINPYRCLSYITQMRGFIPEEFQRPLGNRVFGCDTCQEACPHNMNVKIPDHIEFKPEFPLETNLEKLAKLSKRDFNKVFKVTAAGWRGRNVIRRNAVCALGNMRDVKYKKLLETLSDDPSEIVSKQALWSLKNLISV
ncbi:MAG: tRNA epoxyqueuosine(34) reductase QueG [Thermoanaerobacteraceae bacterium]|nr:tRNA epoxyqueuosine(34) reductase QueG [Thermoanaerobacteraceae bacterium]